MRNETATRVAWRYAAAKRLMKPEKMTELLLKVRKGSNSFKNDVLEQIFQVLGGWKIETMLYFSPTSSRDDNKNYYTHVREDEVLRSWEEAKSLEKASLPASAIGFKEYDRVLLDVKEPYRDSSGRLGYAFREWEVRDGVRVTAPNNKAWETPETLLGFMSHYPSSVPTLKPDGSAGAANFYKWLVSETPFMQQVNEKLGTESHEAEKARKQKERTRDNTGTCPACFNNVKLTPAAKKGDRSLPGMVLHGYKRPGLGYIYGDCFGMDWPPYELSPLGTKAYRDLLEDNEKRLEKQLRDLPETTLLPDAAGRAYKKEETDPKRWEFLMEGMEKSISSNLFFLRQDLKRLNKAISSWQLSPLPKAL